MRLIDADEALRLFGEEYEETKELIHNGETQLDSLAEGFTEAHHIIKYILPTVDVAPVVHARWVSFLDGDHIMPERYYRCSRCGRVESRRQPYCHCGAKMDGKKVVRIC